MRHFNAALARELEQAQRSRAPLSLLMCDLDYLRNINNTYGHQAGDLVLKGIADLMRREVRACDVAARFGGEEFVVLLPGLAGAAAVEVAERLRRAVEQAQFSLAAGPRAGADTGAGAGAGAGEIGRASCRGSV